MKRDRKSSPEIDNRQAQAEALYRVLRGAGVRSLSDFRSLTPDIRRLAEQAVFRQKNPSQLPERAPESSDLTWSLVEKFFELADVVGEGS